MNTSITCYDSKGKVLESLTQWDANVTIEIAGAETSSTPTLHFCQKGRRAALVTETTLEGDKLKSKVPNLLLQSRYPLIVYLYYGTHESEQRSLGYFTIPIIPREMPMEYIYQENIGYETWVEMVEEAQRIVEASEALNERIEKADELVEQLDADVAQSQQAAKEAGQHEAGAQQALSEAEAARDAAKGSAGEAAQSKEAAASSASQASTDAGLAKQYAEQAQQSETAAETAQGEAEQARDDATTQAEAAAGSATTATEQANSAQQSAQAADESEAKAQEYEAAAEAASQTATEKAAAAEASAAEADTSAQAAAASDEDAQAQAEAAKQSAQQASDSKTAAETAKTEAEAAEAAAQAAQSSAESAKEEATQQADEAAQSAETAKQYSGKPPQIGENGNWETWNADTQTYTDTGHKSVLTYDITYTTVEEMEEDESQPLNTLAIISTDINEEDNAQLYIWNGSGWKFLADLSGFTGVGIESIECTSGDHAPGTCDTYTITFTDQSTTDFQVYNGNDGLSSFAVTDDGQGNITVTYS